METIWAAIKSHPWYAAVGAAGLGGILLYAFLHKGSGTTNPNTTDLLATSGGGPTTTLTGNGTGDGSGGGGGGGGNNIPTGVGASPANPVNGVNPILTTISTGDPDTPAYPPSPSTPPSANIPLPTIAPPAPAPPVVTPATPAPIPVGLTGVNYAPTPNTPNQITVGSANGLTAIALPVGETINTPVMVPNKSAGNPVVPLSDLISTGSANTLSSAYGTAASAAALIAPLPTIKTTPAVTKTTAVAKVSTPPPSTATHITSTPPTAATVAATIKGDTPAVKASVASATKAAAAITY